MSSFRSMPAAVAVLALLCRGHSASGAELPATRTFDANGVKLAYFVQGKGEPVVLLHGWLASAGINWYLPGISTKLAEEFQIIALDVRGHGLSDKPKSEDAYGPELVEDVVRLMDHLKLKQAHIVGYSMGGIIAANFIVKYPKRVQSGTLGGMGWLKEGDVAQWAFAQIAKDNPNADALAICGRSLSKLALTEKEIKSIKTPMRVIVGDKDDIIKKLYIVDRLDKARPDWPVVEIKNGDHITCILRPQFRDEIAKWLKENRRDKSPPANRSGQ